MSHRSFWAILLLGCCWSALAQLEPATLKPPAKNYILTPNDVVHVKVFREDNLETRTRIANDGAITFPLLGSIQIGGKTIEQATLLIRDLLAKDYLVNPQVSLSIVEFAKRRFTVLGQVQKPGTYEMPENQPMNLLQAISMAGGYTPIANPTKITVQRQQAERTLTFKLNAKAMAKDKNMQSFQILPEDTISVGESIF